jgi:hypothetical protein
MNRDRRWNVKCFAADGVAKKENLVVVVVKAFLGGHRALSWIGCSEPKDATTTSQGDAVLGDVVGDVVQRLVSVPAPERSQPQPLTPAAGNRSTTRNTDCEY